MSYQETLGFLQKSLKKYRLQALLVDPQTSAEEIDLGIRVRLGVGTEYTNTLRRGFDTLKPNVLYKLTDQFLCSYLLLQLPSPDPNAFLVLTVGPYFDAVWTREDLLEQAERSGLLPQHFYILEQYYSMVPYVADEALLLSLIQTVAEDAWQMPDTFQMININRERPSILATLPHPTQSNIPEDTEETMRLMEERYAHENTLMQIVSQGLSHKAELALAAFNPLVFEQRTSEPVRNMKNYCIIMNTLMRKAAENGGVHPIFLDKISSSFAHKIEATASTAAIKDLMAEMLRSYCRLVRKNSTKKYSSPVQKAIIRIEANLNGDLSLKTLAEAQNISASYLSGLFKKETGQTITEYVNEKRVKLAQHLLRTSHLQVQTIAQHCGIPDVNYFSKVFKKYLGKTPKEYRKETSLQKLR